MLASQITQENIKEFVILFYTKILNDEKIAHYFTDMLGDDMNNAQWQEHIDILIDFWSSMVLNGDNYTGSPFAPHEDMNLTMEDFTQWMLILDATLNEVYEYEASKPIREIGIIMSKNFLKQLGVM